MHCRESSNCRKQNCFVHVTSEVIRLSLQHVSIMNRHCTELIKQPFSNIVKLIPTYCKTNKKTVKYCEERLHILGLKTIKFIKAFNGYLLQPISFNYSSFLLKKYLTELEI